MKITFGPGGNREDVAIKKNLLPGAAGSGQVHSKQNGECHRRRRHCCQATKGIEKKCSAAGAADHTNITYKMMIFTLVTVFQSLHLPHILHSPAAPGFWALRSLGSARSSRRWQLLLRVFGGTASC
eukprot:gene10206-biopygen3276